VKHLNHLLLLTAVLLIAPNVGNAVDDVVDNFSKPDWKGRQALPYEWKFENNQANCVSDPEFYRKIQTQRPDSALVTSNAFQRRHGRDGVSTEKCQRIVITLNNKIGHVFRVALTDNAKTKTRIFGWAHPSKDKPSETLAQKGVPTSKDLDSQWVQFRLAISGSEARLQTAKFSETLKHASIAR